MLIAYGVSLRLGPLPGAGEPPVQIATIVALKLVVQPLAAYLIARYALGLPGPAVFAVTVIAALPTAQNVFTLAVRYHSASSWPATRSSIRRSCPSPSSSPSPPCSPDRHC